MDIQVGKSRIRIDPGGIRIQAGRISLAADVIELVAQKGASSLSLAGGVGLAGGEVVVASKGAQLKLDGEAHLDGARVLLNCGAGPAPGAKAGMADDMGTLTFQLTNPKAVEGEHVTVVLLSPTGETVERPLGPDGTVTVEGRPGERWSLVDVRTGAGSLSKKGS